MATTTNKIKIRDKDMDLEDKDYSLIITLQELTKVLNKLAGRR